MTKYIADVQIEVELEEGDEEVAFKVIDETLQRAWDTDQGRVWLAKNWHFEMTEGCVSQLDDQVPDEVTSR